MNLKDNIRQQAHAAGFNAVGFADAETDPKNRANLEKYLLQGRHGDMGWMAEHVNRRVAPQGIWPEARSVIVLAMAYGSADSDPINQADRGTISV